MTTTAAVKPKPGELYTAWQGFSCSIEGRIYVVAKGQSLRGDHALVRARGAMFLPAATATRADFRSMAANARQDRQDRHDRREAEERERRRREALTVAERARELAEREAARIRAWNEGS